MTTSTLIYSHQVLDKCVKSIRLKPEQYKTFRESETLLMSSLENISDKKLI